MSSAHLSGGKINIARVQEYARKHLFALLDKIDGTKEIFADAVVGPVLGLVSNKAMFREHNVKNVVQLQGGNVMTSGAKNVVFIISTKLCYIDWVAEYVHNEVKRGNGQEFHIFFVPKITFLCKKRLEDRGVLGTFGNNIEELPLYLFPIDNDLMSMEISSTFKEFHLGNDPTTLHQTAEGLLMLQSLFGAIPRITGIGPAAQRVADFVKRLAVEQSCCQNPASSSIVPSQIDQLILLDRSVDLLTPLATQLTYEGLIDEIFGIHNTTVKLPAEHFSSSNETSTNFSPEVKAIILNSGEELFAEIRDKNFSAVGPALSKKAKLISSQFQERHGDKTVQEMKQFVSRLPYMMANKQSLAYHTTIAELVMKETDSSHFLKALETEQELMNGIDTDKVHPYIEDCIDRKQPLTKVLRLVCMQALTNSGLRPKVLEYYKREILQTYGFQHVLTLSNLEQSGLLRVQQNQRQYTVLRKALRLTVEDNSEVSPTDISYVHSVYAPLSIRLVQHLVRPNGPRALQDVIGLLPSPAFDEIQPSLSGSPISSQASGDSPRVVLVFFLGGCTFAEISALRFLSQQEDTDTNVEFVIGTTKLINGKTFIESMSEPLTSEHI